MKNKLLSLSLITVASVLIFTSCKKEVADPLISSQDQIVVSKTSNGRVTTPGIVYVPINITLTANVNAYSGTWSGSVDMDQDSATDFTFTTGIAHSRGNDFYQIATSISATATGGGLLSTWGPTVLSGAPSAWVSYPVNAGTVIGSVNTTYANPASPSTYLYSYYFGPRKDGLIIGKGNKLVGMRFVSGGNTYYGWFTVNVSANGRVFKIIVGAFNNLPNTSIIAGAVN